MFRVSLGWGRRSVSCSIMSNTLWPRRAPLSMGFSRPSLGGLPDPGIEPESPTLQTDSLVSEPLGKPKNTRVSSHCPQRACPIHFHSWIFCYCFIPWCLHEFFILLYSHMIHNSYFISFCDGLYGSLFWRICPAVFWPHTSESIPIESRVSCCNPNILRKRPDNTIF